MLPLVKFIINFTQSHVITNSQLTFLNLHQHAKNQLSSSASIHLVGATIYDHTHPNIFLSTLNDWYQPKKPKSRLFHHIILEIFDLKLYNLIGQHRFGPIWLRNKLTDLLILPLTKKMMEKQDGRKLKMDSVIMVRLQLYGARMKHL